MLENLAWTMGTDDAATLLKQVEQYDLTDIAGRIQCPTLVLEAEHDHFLPGQPQRLYDALTSTKASCAVPPTRAPKSTATLAPSP